MAPRLLRLPRLVLPVLVLEQPLVLPVLLEQVLVPVLPLLLHPLAPLRVFLVQAGRRPVLHPAALPAQSVFASWDLPVSRLPRPRPSSSSPL